MKLSLIIPVYNKKPFLKRCFNSIASQINESVEVVVIDDRSTDGSSKICDEYEDKGFKVIIAGAGMAAHLPGMCAAIFPMPVIGIPISTKNTGGVDALWSTVQMPSGIPVATVAIDGAANAALLAIQMLAITDAELAKKLDELSLPYVLVLESSDKKLAETVIASTANKSAEILVIDSMQSVTKKIIEGGNYEKIYSFVFGIYFFGSAYRLPCG